MRQGMCTSGQKGKEYLAPNWLYGSRSLDLRRSWLLKELSKKKQGEEQGQNTRSKCKLFSMLSTWVRWGALVKNLALQMLVYTTVFQAARISHPELLFSSSHFFFFSCLWFSTWPGHLYEVMLHCGDSTWWLFLYLSSGVCWLPTECLQWNDPT